MTEIVYSQTRHPLAEGRLRLNPRFFAGVQDGATKALIVGDFPQILAAYAAAGIPAERVDAPEVREPVAAPAELTPVADDRSAVVIPDDWRELNYNRPKPDRDITQRAIAAQLSAEPILNKEQAISVIEAELERRAADVNPEPEAGE
ncbi:hypothetical protein ACO2Q0_02615 [Phenylobacterium sp. VNQ135]|uniref:hypothetical protein n=1 Tax=Phenylobacterium sp. VNQ135 TaxID=3400922 RepID=UPI003C0B05B2